MYLFCVLIAFPLDTYSVMGLSDHLVALCLTSKTLRTAFHNGDINVHAHAIYPLHQKFHCWKWGFNKEEKKHFYQDAWQVVWKHQEATGTHGKEKLCHSNTRVNRQH